MWRREDSLAPAGACGCTLVLCLGMYSVCRRMRVAAGKAGLDKLLHGQDPAQGVQAAKKACASSRAEEALGRMYHPVREWEAF